MSTKIIGKNIKKNGSLVKEKMNSAYNSVSQANSSCSSLSWVGPISSTNKNIITILNLAKKVVNEEQEYNLKYIKTINKWDSLSNKIKSAKSENDTNALKSLFNKSKKLIGKKATMAFYKRLGYDVIISGKTVSIVKKSKASKSKSSNSSSKSSKSNATSTVAVTSATAASTKKKSNSKISTIAGLKKDLKNALKDGKKEKGPSYI